MGLEKSIKMSVRNLVEFILRCGDISSGFSRSGRALEGTRIHKKLQKAAKGDYEAEVMLNHVVEYDKFTLVVEGRADGIIRQDGRVTIDEIKTTTAQLEIIDEDYNPIHWAQAKCYAYFFIVGQEYGSIDVRLTYYQVDDDEIKYLTKTFMREELKEFFQDLISKYYVWAKWSYEWNIKRDGAIKELTFPYSEYRKGQRELAVAVYKTIRNEKKCFAQAPTGIGKTMSTLFPSIKAIGEGLISKVFYLTAKTITRSVAQDAVSAMREKGLNLKTVTITAKDKVCFKEETNCNPEECEFAKGHYDRINVAIMDIVSNEDNLTRQVIEKYAKRHTVCPFEFTLDLTMWADTVICDYNYIFDPSVGLKRFFAEKGGDYVFLVDEAHNLVDRAREMFSAEIFKKPFMQLKKALKDSSPKVVAVLNKINKYFVELRKLCDEKDFVINVASDKDVYFMLHNFMKVAEGHLLKHKGQKLPDELLQLYFDSISFVRAMDKYDERFVTYIEKIDDDVRLKVFCYDPSLLLREALKKGMATVFFSATLLPLEYHRYILGGDEEDYMMYIDSPFEKENRCILVADKVSTRYKDREDTYNDIVHYINALIKAKKGNYIVFFPSYRYMNAVYEIFMEQCPDVEVHIQAPSMDETEREEFLELFKESPQHNTLAFCVLGGIYSEGIDLKYDRLIGAIVVGVGLPQICIERDIIRSKFNSKSNKGYEYAYIYPGMNKVLQAAGRVIRSEVDKGIIMLIDSRFVNQSYQDLFPKEWFPYIRVNKTNIDRSLGAFWEKHDFLN